MKKFLLFSQAVLLFTFFSLLANNTLKVKSYDTYGKLQGKVTDAKTKEGIAFATIKLLKDGAMVTGTVTDLDGNYSIIPISPGKYSLCAIALSYDTARFAGIEIMPDVLTIQDIKMGTASHTIQTITIRAEKLISADVVTGHSYSSSEIQQSAVQRSNVNNIQALTGGVAQSDYGRGLNINGSRSYSQKYVVDGIPMNGSIGLPDDKIESLTTLTGGVPARYENDSSKNGGIVFSAPPPPPAPVQTVTPTPPPAYYPDAEFAPLIENEFESTRDKPLSTFSIDVDDASYANFRRYINSGMLPPKDAIRIEEFINNFTYNYPQPTDEHPFSISMEQAICPWNTAHSIVGIGIKGKTIDYDKLPPSNLVFLIDVSGSMQPDNRLPLIKRCFALLTKQLRPQDKVAIVTYAGNAGLALPTTSGKEKDKILQALDRLEAGGSTAGGAGIELAYKIAKDNFIKGGNNRVILATDGDFNVGISSDGDLLTLIESKRGDGIFLTTIGVGEDNYKDAKMELLADKGNGNYSYIDTYEQGRKVFEQQLTSTLFTIAKDVKLQIEFNPLLVKGYRLIGYEDRLLNKEDFNDDTKDAGELGTGHTVTAFYELVPAGSTEKLSKVDTLKYQSVTMNSRIASDEVLTLKMRYKAPDKDTSKLIVRPLKNNLQPINSCSSNFQFATAVAEFAIVLRQSKFKSSATFAQAIALARNNKGADDDGLRAEFLKLATTAQELAANTQAKK